MTAGFARPLLDRLRDEIQVRIETRPTPDGPVHTAIIWIVVDDVGRVLVRSWRGATARWYREAISGTEVGLIVARERLPVSVERATDADRVAACSAELERKYAGDPAVRSMVRDEILDTTLELRPA
jgi:hypothetical protein